jgi:hypothetical protein
MIKQADPEMKMSKYAVVYSIALAVASIGVTPVMTISAFAKEIKGQPKDHGRPHPKAGISSKLDNLKQDIKIEQTAPTTAKVPLRP